MAFWKKKQSKEQAQTPAAEQSEPAPTPDVTPVEPEVAPISDVAAEVPAAKPEPVRRRSEVMKLRLSPDELAYITEQAKAAGMSRTDYLMAAAKGEPVIVIQDVPRLLVELRKEGVNLNQAVRLAHEKGSANLPDLQAALQRCAEAQAEVVRMCDYWNMRLQQTQSEVNENGDHNDKGVEGDTDQGN